MADLEFIASVPGGDDNPPIGKDILQIPPGSGEPPTDDTIKKGLQEISQWEQITQESTDSTPGLGKEIIPDPGSGKPGPIKDPEAEPWDKWIEIEGKDDKNNYLQWQIVPGSPDQQKNPKDYWWVTYIEGYTTLVFEAIVITPPSFLFPIDDFVNYINSDLTRSTEIQNTRFSNPGFVRNWQPPFVSYAAGPPVFLYRPVDWIKLTSEQSEALAVINDSKPDVTTIIWANIDIFELP